MSVVVREDLVDTTVYTVVHDYTAVFCEERVLGTCVAGFIYRRNSYMIHKRGWHAEFPRERTELSGSLKTKVKGGI
jgi:hypothetical protein